MIEIVPKEKNENQVTPLNGDSKHLSSTIAYTINMKPRGAHMQYMGHVIRDGRFGGKRHPVSRKYAANTIGPKIHIETKANKNRQYGQQRTDHDQTQFHRGRGRGLHGNARDRRGQGRNYNQQNTGNSIDITTRYS